LQLYFTPTPWGCQEAGEKIFHVTMECGILGEKKIAIEKERGKE